ncbi:MAG: NAD(P)-binding domain-containing protein, partial [bacterium]
MGIGFIGLGVMGQPMALNLAKAGMTLTVWNRSPEKCLALAAAGARVAADPAEVFSRSAVVFLMLSGTAATNEILGRDTPAFAQNVSGRTLVSMATLPPEYSRSLEA